jgi:hypothetical protein
MWLMDPLLPQNLCFQNRLEQKFPSELNTSINSIDLLQVVAEATFAHAPVTIWIQKQVNNQLEVSGRSQSNN